VTSNTQGPRGTIQYTYQPTDAVGSYTVTGGPTASYTYYPDGSLNTIQWTPVAGEFKYRYTRAGQYETVTFPNGQTRNYSYDDQGRLLALANLHPTAGNLATYGYGYDLNHATGANTMLGQRVTMTANVPAQGFANAVTKYYYDAAYQLTRADYPAGAPFNGEVHQWTYDLIGNRLTNTVNGVTQNHTYQKLGANPKNWQRLLTDGVNSYTYDANGSPVASAHGALTWDFDGRLDAVGSSARFFTYDALNRRTNAREGSETTSYVYENFQIIRISGATTAANWLFGIGLDRPLVMSDSDGTVQYPVVDGVGSLTANADAAGNLVSPAAFDAWGRMRSQTAVDAMAFTSRPRSAVDLYNLRARDYSAIAGRFLTEDPLPEWIGRTSVPSFGHPFTYAENDPINRRDPLGLKPCEEPKPRPPGMCAAGCMDRYFYGLCQLGELNAADFMVKVAFAGLGAVGGGLTCGVKCACVGGAGGFALGMIIDTMKAKGPEVALKQTKDNCIAQCKAMTCKIPPPFPAPPGTCAL
jgi:RHS repeat-associated protein